MAIRQLGASLCIMSLLLAVAFVGAQTPAPPTPDQAATSPDPFNDPELVPHNGDPVAAGRIRQAEAACYKTATQVPTKCTRQFIRAIFEGKTVTDWAITPDCCRNLACVREWTCADTLRGVCVPPERDQCPPPPTAMDVTEEAWRLERGTLFCHLDAMARK